jgi:hypothetical protein
MAVKPSDFKSFYNRVCNQLIYIRFPQSDPITYFFSILIVLYYINRD